ncbi:CinA family protein [Ideonella sp.]|uniref:CinA family protein n=1 Tax=Ideonella sp. TaxID=1929293 RepID=UPI0035B0B18D
MDDASPLLPDTAWLPAVQALAEALRRRGTRVATAESCTGGLIGAACTHLAGSSDWYERGWVTYSNEAKTELLGVPAALIVQHGAVSAEVARAMAEGALARSRAQAAVAVTGIAGPGGATPGKPVGLVWRGLAWRDAGGQVRAEAAAQVFAGDRAQVRGATVQWALSGLLALARAR